ncbi:MAG: toprim domain-containing protein, partial [Silicimonas sp.]|nr:toprim domain-containing protein [Silicimonas sp.]
ITENQLELMWRMHEEPVIALDGDKAGLRAAMRVIDLAMPLLQAGKSLRFCLMPEGMDPDDLLRDRGAGAMQDLLDQSIPLVQLLWQRETEGKVFDSPERKAALDQSLRGAILKLRDPSLRRHYGEEINRLRKSLFDPRPASGGDRPFRAGRGPRGAQPPRHALTSTKASALAAAGAPFEEQLKEALILAVLVRHPGLVPQFLADLERLETAVPEHETVRAALIRFEGAEPEEIERECGSHALEKLHAPRHVRISPAMQPGAGADVAAMTVGEELAKLTARRGARREIEEAMRDIEGLADEGLTWRLAQVAESLTGPVEVQGEDTAEFDTGANGARMRRDEKNDFDALLGRIDFAKGRGGA